MGLVGKGTAVVDPESQRRTTATLRLQSWGRRMKAVEIVGSLRYNRLLKIQQYEMASKIQNTWKRFDLRHKKRAVMKKTMAGISRIQSAWRERKANQTLQAIRDNEIAEQQKQKEWLEIVNQLG